MSSCRGGHMSVKEGLGGSVYEESHRRWSHTERLTSPWNRQPQAPAGYRRLIPSPWWLAQLKSFPSSIAVEWGRDVT